MPFPSCCITISTSSLSTILYHLFKLMTYLPKTLDSCPTKVVHFILFYSLLWHFSCIFLLPFSRKIHPSWTYVAGSIFSHSLPLYFYSHLKVLSSSTPSYLQHTHNLISIQLTSLSNKRYFILLCYNHCFCSFFFISAPCFSISPSCLLYTLNTSLINISFSILLHLLSKHFSFPSSCTKFLFFILFTTCLTISLHSFLINIGSFHLVTFTPSTFSSTSFITPFVFFPNWLNLVTFSFCYTMCLCSTFSFEVHN